MLVLKSVSVEFPVEGGTVCSVDQVSMTISNNARHVVVGETGSGKSVLLMSILGFSGGSVRGKAIWNGKDLFAMNRKEYAAVRGREIAYIPQGSANGMNPLIRVGEQIAEPLMVHAGMKRTPALAKAVEAMKKLDFPQPELWARRYPHNLSGGMRQRALVAMGTSIGSGLLLADEPTKGLDESRRAEVEGVFRSLEATVLCVTHDLDFARSVGQRISVMYAGQIVETAGVDELFHAPFHPYSRMLIDSLPENGFRFPSGFAPSHSGYSGLGCRFMARCPCAADKCQERPPVRKFGEREVQCWHAAGDTEIE